MAAGAVQLAWLGGAVIITGVRIAGGHPCCVVVRRLSPTRSRIEMGLHATSPIAFVHKNDVPSAVTDVYGNADDWGEMSQELEFDLPAPADPDELTISSHGLDSPTPSV